MYINIAEIKKIETTYRHFVNAQRATKSYNDIRYTYSLIPFEVYHHSTKGALLCGKKITAQNTLHLSIIFLATSPTSFTETYQYIQCTQISVSIVGICMPWSVYEFSLKTLSVVYLCVAK